MKKGLTLKLLICFTVILLCKQGIAQKALSVTTVNGARAYYSLSNIHKITFQTDSMQLYQADGSINKYARKDLAYMTHITYMVKTIQVQAGGLSVALSAIEKKSITSLKLTGTIDARDFKTMRDSMPLLASVDFSGATISAYNGNLGTAGSAVVNYDANAIPRYAFRGSGGLNIVVVPSSITVIGAYAFYYCNGLQSFIIHKSSPVDLSLSPNVFYGASTVQCTLSVPLGSDSVYKVAPQWQAFTKVVEHKYRDVLGVNKPTTVGNKGTAYISVNGNGMQTVKKVRLLYGDSVLIADTVLSELSTVIARFNFDNTKAGLYDVEVQFADTVIMLKKALTVEEYKPIELAVSIVGANSFRSTSTSTYTISVENKGNHTAYFVPLNVVFSYANTGSINYLKILGDSVQRQKFAEFFADSSYVEKQTLDILKEFDSTFTDLNHFMEIYDQTTGKYYLQTQLYIPQIESYGTKVLSFKVKATSSIELYVSVPNNWDLESQYNASLSSLKSGSKTLVDKIDCAVDLAVCLADIVSPLPELMNKDCIKESLKSTFINTSNEDKLRLALSTLQGLKKGISDGKSFDGVFNSAKNEAIGSLAQSFLLSSLACLLQKGIEKTIFKAMLKSNVILKGVNIGMSCIPAIYNATAGNCFGDDDSPNENGNKNNQSYASATKQATFVKSCDPNNKIGYQSPSGSRYFNADQNNFTYIINFENKATATAPAQAVYVTDTLDMNSFDINSFRAGFILIGSKMVQAPYNVQNHTWSIDLRPANNVITQVNLHLDTLKGIARWTFTSLDPVTDSLVTDPLAGFLPHNDSVGSGQGSVCFTINLKNKLGDGAKIQNKATIVFDDNEPITTPTWSNTKDIIAPVSTMNEPIVKTDSTAIVKWQAVDNAGGSGIYAYNVFMKEGTGAYQQLISNSLVDSLAFIFKNDITYSFYVNSVDSADNKENKTNVPDVTFLKSATGSKYVTQNTSNEILYPNPTSRSFTIKLEGETQVQIYNMQGIQVYENTVNGNEPISVAGWAKGLYIVKIKTPTNMQIQNLIVE